jgi:hypothetical protein
MKFLAQEQYSIREEIGIQQIFSLMDKTHSGNQVNSWTLFD